MFSFDPGFRPAYHIYRILWTGLDWLYPPKCFGCDIIGTRWCQSCQDQVAEISPPFCPHCGQPNNSIELCRRCSKVAPAYLSLRSVAGFDGTLKTAFHRLKYKGDIGLGESLSRPLVRYYRTLDWRVDFVTPIPTSPKRASQRGYNQAALIALPFALAVNIPYRPGALVRVKETASQVGLTAIERVENLKGAFQAPPGAVDGKSVLVIDDVTTTGATLDDASRALIEGGADRVYCLTVARSLLKNQAN